MESTSLRDRLHEYIDKADERKLSAIYVLIEDELDEEPVYTKETISMIHERRNSHLNGKSKSYTPQESFELIRGSKK